METTTNPARLWTVQDVAAFTNLSVCTVRRKIDAGELPAVRLGGSRSPIRVDPVDLERFVFGEEEL